MEVAQAKRPCAALTMKAAAWVRRALADAWEHVRCVWALLAATWRVSVLQRVLVAQDFVVYKVVALNEDDGTDAIVTRAFSKGDGWEDSVRAATGWTRQKLRVEVRYLARGKKFRAVLRPGDAWELRGAPERHRGGPKGVMAAELVGDGVTVDITRRIHKYEGPAKDFHRLRVGVTDMFPFDDADELRVNFHTLRLIDAHARVLNVPMGCDDLMVALAASAKAD